MTSKTLLDCCRRHRFMSAFPKVLKLLRKVEGTHHSREDMALLRFERGVAHFNVGDYLAAMRDFEAAYAALECVTSVEDAAWIVNGYADVLGELGDYDRCMMMFATAYMDHTPIGLVRGYILWNWGRHAFRSDRRNLGMDLMRRGYDCMAELDSIERVCPALDLADAYLTIDKPDAAFSLLKGVESLTLIYKPAHRARFDDLLSRACWTKRAD